MVKLAPVECIQDRSTEVCISSSTKSATFQLNRCWLQFTDTVLLPPWHCIWQQNCSLSQTLMHVDDCDLLPDQCSLHLAPLMLPLVTTPSRWLLQTSSVWHSQPDQPESVRASMSLSVLRSRLKTELFAWSYRSLMLHCTTLTAE